MTMTLDSLIQVSRLIKMYAMVPADGDSVHLQEGATCLSKNTFSRLERFIHRVLVYKTLWVLTA